MYEYRARCVHVVDGDTYDFLVDLGFHITHKVRVRLKDVDTPEVRASTLLERRHAFQATEFCRVKLGETGHIPVTIKTEKDRLGKYGRYTASVTLADGSDLGQLLLEAGLEKKDNYSADPEPDASDR